MAIEKMSLVNIVGNIEDLDSVLVKCLESGYFHPEKPIHNSDSHYGFKLLEGANPYTALMNTAERLIRELNIEAGNIALKKSNMSNEDIAAFLEELDQKAGKLADEKREVTESISMHEQASLQITHLAGLNVSFDNIFGCEYVKVRFGRMPSESYKKLSYYDNKTFFFFPFDNDGEYCWGVYFAPSTKIAVIDDIFSALYFERIRVPDYAHGTPEIAAQSIKQLLEDEKSALEAVLEKQKKLKEEYFEKLTKIYSGLAFENSTYSLRHYVATVNNRFYAEGFIPKANSDEFANMFDEEKSVSCTVNPADADPSLEPPIKLKNNRFVRPFEMFVKMYSLPSHKDIDPTPLVAITYTLLFGIMFGDVGQGVLMAIFGLILAKWKKMTLGNIMIRIGISSACFGFLYGSVFGYEHLLDPMYKAMGFSEKPLDVFATDTTNLLLMSAIFIGVFLIMLSIIVNIIMGFKTKDYERAIFGNNGIAGLVLYCAAVFLVCDMMLLNTGICGPLYIVFLIVLPVLIIFFRSPLTKLMSKNRKHLFGTGGIGEFIIENFFELFEYVLSYLSNSMSFLRVGGFILSHAGMMAVVMSLSEMVGGGASPVVVILGNLFVMCLEGLIVGIQVLRLEFYEMFSRHFEGNGKPFIPAGSDTE